MITYPDKIQADAVKLVDAALSVAALPEVYDEESLKLASEYLERQISGCRTLEANKVLGAIVDHYKTTDIVRA
jgi:hypothetical protein